MEPSATSLRQAVRALLQQEAARTELRLAVIRVAAFGLVVVLDVGLYLAGRRPLENLFASGPALVAAVAILVLLRHYFQRWVSFVIPLLDAVIIASVMSGRLPAEGIPPETFASGAVGFGLFAATGGMRFERGAAAWTASLAVAAFAVSMAWRVNPVLTLYTMVGIGAIGLLAGWQTQFARRALEGERGRAVLKRFLHEDVVDRAFSDPSGLMMLPREVDATVLVTDLRDFTALAERLPPFEVLELLSEIQTELAAAVRANGGVVDKFMGDGMLATFGAMGVHEGHAQRAVAATRDICQRVERVNASHPDRPRLRIGVGVHTGRLVAGTMGRGDRVEFTVLGDTVNTAARLEGLTKELGIQVAISEATAEVAGAELKLVGTTPVRGRAEPVQVFTLKEAAQSR